MKYELDRLGSDNFEYLIQSLIRGMVGNAVIIFGDGPDGQREAVIEHANHTITDSVQAQGRTIVQAKFKSPDGKEDDWTWLRKNLKHELDGFLEKSQNHPQFIPDTLLFFTNVILTPKLDQGIRDRAEQFITEYKSLIPNIYLLGADDIRTMLDNNRDVARGYMSFIMPGDVLSELHDTLQALHNENFEDLIEYARQMFREDRAVRLEQAGDASIKSINIRNVYTDLEAKSLSSPSREIPKLAAHIVELGNRVHKRERLESSICSRAFSTRHETPPEGNIVLIGGAGQGKSTLCQYICQLYRSALLKRYRENAPEFQFPLAEDAQSAFPIPQCERFPVLINLKRYAAWINQQTEESGRSVLAYMLSLINGKASSALSIQDLRRLMSGCSWVFLFDGLDEVPASSNRSEVLKQIQIFLDTDLIEEACDCLVICTSRPQGYDDAFSTAQYNHFELQDMSPSLCITYIDRLLTFLEDNSETRESYRQILIAALDDSMISKLMTTPLYTAIIVMLVMLGGTPPNKRYALFANYTDIVIRRERQKGTLPKLHNEYEWIKPLHAEIGFLLQSESESAKNAAAELSTTRCKQLIEHFLEDEEAEGNIPAMTEEFYQALTTRLSFISAVTGADQESSILFPLRSMQEYFAAEWIISFDDDDALSTALEIISISAYWRNVYLFVAGYFARHANRRNINDRLFMICQRNNGDENYDSPNPAAYCIALQGSKLALALLCDSLFSRRANQNRYLNIAAQLLGRDNTSDPQNMMFLRLPPPIADTFLRERVIPHILHAKNANDMGFGILWTMAAKGHEYARVQLDLLVQEIATPTSTTILWLLNRGFKEIGERALCAIYRWITEDLFDDFSYPFLTNDLFWSFMKHYWERMQISELSLQELRGIMYNLLAYLRFRDDIKHFSNISNIHPLIEKLVRDCQQNNLFFLTHHGKLGTSYEPIIHDWPAAYLSSYADEFRTYGLDELAALMEFLHAPSQLRLIALLNTYRGLPSNCKSSLIRLLRMFNWLLQALADTIRSTENTESILARFNDEYINSCLQTDRKLVELVDQGDFVAITMLNGWEMIRFPYTASIPPKMMNKILKNVKKEHVGKGFLSFLSAATVQCSKNSPKIFQFALKHFPLLFQFDEGIALAISAFLAAPLRDLIADPLEYPKAFLFGWVYHSIGKSNADALLERIDQMISLGDEYLQAYALLPQSFMLTKNELLTRVPVDTLISQLHTISDTGNRSALLGCLLRILAAPLNNVQQEVIRAMLEDLLVDPSMIYVWFTAAEAFSLDGKIMIYRTISMLGSDFEDGPEFLDKYANVIFEHLEGSPIEYTKLMELSRSAHRSQHLE